MKIETDEIEKALAHIKKPDSLDKETHDYSFKVGQMATILTIEKFFASAFEDSQGDKNLGRETDKSYCKVVKYDEVIKTINDLKELLIKKDYTLKDFKKIIKS